MMKLGQIVSFHELAGALLTGTATYDEPR